MIFSRKSLLILLFLYPTSILIAQKVPVARNLLAPKGSITSKSITILWDKPEHYKDITAYQVFKDGELAGTSTKTNFTVDNLEPGKKYKFYIEAQDKTGKLSKASNKISAATRVAGKVFNILDYGAKGDGATKNTQAIQQAIDACTNGGTVYYPIGTF